MKKKYFLIIILLNLYLYGDFSREIEYYHQKIKNLENEYRENAFQFQKFIDDNRGMFTRNGFQSEDTLRAFVISSWLIERHESLFMMLQKKIHEIDQYRRIISILAIADTL